MSDTSLRVISLGAGVQSSTMALMVAVGELEDVDAAIFADTGSEPKSVYDWLDWLEKQLPFPVYRVSAGDLASDTLKIRTSRKSGMRYINSAVPMWMKTAPGKSGPIGRRCTRDYKINPIMRKVRELRKNLCLAGILLPNVEQWIGISTDEAHRMKPSSVKYVINRWPLIERRMRRSDCLRWMESHGYPTPPRSACVFCPYHSDAEWIRLRDKEPEAFQAAIRYEQTFQTAALEQEALKGTAFLHKSLVPLDQVQFKGDSKDQPDLFGNECEGMCGV